MEFELRCRTFLVLDIKKENGKDGHDCNENGKEYDNNNDEDEGIIIL